MYQVTNKSVVVITLHTGPDTPNVAGFSLEYVTSYNGYSRLPSPKSEDFMIDSLSGYLKYPESGIYADNEVATFAFVPPNNIRPENFTMDLDFVVFEPMEPNNDMVTEENRGVKSEV